MAARTLLEDLGCYNSDIVDLSVSSQDAVILNTCKDGMELGSMHCLVNLELNLLVPKVIVILSSAYNIM